MRQARYEITGMSCAACAAHVEKSVARLPGTEKVNVSLLTNTLSLEYDERETGEADIFAAVKSAGYGAAREEHSGEAARAARAGARMSDQLARVRKRFLISLGLLLPLMYLSMQHMGGWPLPAFMEGGNGALPYALGQLILAVPIALINLDYFKNGMTALFHGGPNMDTLIAVGSGVSLLFSLYITLLIALAASEGAAAALRHRLYFESAAMILTLVTLGKFLEQRSRGKTGAAIEKLMDLSPKTAALLDETGAERSVPVSEVREGDLLIVRPGERIPVDGVIERGESAVDCSAMTGESMPVDKAAGDSAEAGTVNISGSFVLRAVRVGGDTSLSRMIALVEEAASSKAPIARLADKVAGVFVPAVMGIAALTFALWLITGGGFDAALSNAVSVLVISCPCALGLATPVAIMAGTGRAASLGILVRSAETLETAHKLTAAAIDKTGTLTEGRPAVTDIIPSGMGESGLIALAAALEQGSSHPLASAVMELASQRGIRADRVEGFLSITGRGVRAQLNGAEALGGNAALLREHGVELDEAAVHGMTDQGKTVLLFARGGRYAGLIAVADKLKPESADAVSRLKALGVRPVLITGDNARTAAAVAHMAGIDDVMADITPEGKAEAVRTLQESGDSVAMIGDGINDAAALAHADVGMAMGSGTDIALESADMVLLHGDLNSAADAIELSKASMRIIKQNLFWAFFYNTVGIPVAALGLLNPMIAAAAMSLSSVTVVTNALRLNTFSPGGGNKRKPEEKNIMNRTLLIDGMMCAHCAGRVDAALKAVPGVSAVKVELEYKCAEVTGEALSDAALQKAVTDAGYEVKGIQ